MKMGLAAGRIRDHADRRIGARLEIQGGLEQEYTDVYTADALAAIRALAPLDGDRRRLMAERMQRRAP